MNVDAVGGFDATDEIDDAVAAPGQLHLKPPLSQLNAHPDGRDPCITTRDAAGRLPWPPGQSAGILSSHFMCTDRPQSLHVLPCLLSPHIDACARDLINEMHLVIIKRQTLQYAHGEGRENDALLKLCGWLRPSSSAD